LVIISPFIGPLNHVRFKLERLVKKIDDSKIITYVITNEPPPNSPNHSEAINILSGSRFIEIRYNESLHAKVYVCQGNGAGFAMLGSGNLTDTSINQKIEVGVLINERGGTGPLFQELYRWGTERLRTVRGSKIVKRAEYIQSGR